MGSVFSRSPYIYIYIYIYIVYIYIHLYGQDLALNSPQELICHKAQPIQLVNCYVEECADRDPCDLNTNL